MTVLSDRVKRIKPSPTLAVTARAKALKAAGNDIIGLGAGEPDFDTPTHIKQAAIEAINAGFTKYTAVDGTTELKQAICDKFKRDNGFDYNLNQVLVSCGGKQSFYNLAQAMLNKGDDVLIPAPYWVSYPDMVLLADATPVIIPCDIQQAFKLTPEQLDLSITPKTRLLIINSPSNPTGSMYSKAELQALAEVIKAHPDLYVVSDDIYEHTLLDKMSFCNILMASPELYERTIVLNGVSKAYSMTGWRIGYAAGPEDLILAMKKIQSQSTSNPASISQAAALQALQGEQSCIAEMSLAFRQRHDYIVPELNAINGISCLPSQGAFYSFPNCQDAINSIPEVNNDVEFGEYLLDKIGIALVPGSAFGAEGYMRLSFATSMEKLQEAINRLRGLLNT